MFSDIYFRLLLEVMSKDKHIKVIPSLTSSDEKRAALNPVRHFYKLIKSIYEQCPDSSIGLEFGRQVKPINACDFSRLIATSSDVISGLSILADDYPRLNLKPFPMLHKDEQHISMALCFPYEHAIEYGQKRFCSETFYSFCFSLLSDLVEQDVKPLALYLDYPEPSYGKEYRSKFDCEVVFGAPLSMMVFDRGIEHLELLSANECLHGVYLMKAQESWQQIKRQHNFQYRVLSQLMKGFPDGFNGRHLAKTLNISPRGLQKRLSAEGSSFSLLSQVVRRELIKVCLFQRHNDLDEIAGILGFQSQVSFRKFFKLQFGVNPRIHQDVKKGLLVSI
ncbi:MAG: AraC-like DNA-binding protein [Bermanella sp.]|jgi:AraC-like DNA-binding protein